MTSVLLNIRHFVRPAHMHITGLLVLFPVIFAFPEIGKEREHLDVETHFVFTNSGWLQGYFQKTSLGRRIAAFESIPFAEPPTGNLRFRDPILVKNWSGIRDARAQSPSCLQIDFGQFFRLHGTEDCLFLNVYTPVLPPLNISDVSDGLPVLVYLHGGSFTFDKASTYGPSYFLNKDVIFVTVNFRLGVLGFLSTGDENASGNWGLKDQALALHWISDNIKYFGGNKNRITIMGNSAGAGSCGLHAMSKRSKHLFQQAIFESGSPLAFWSLNNDTVDNSKLLAKFVNCPSSDSKAMITCLRGLNANWIVGRSLDGWKMLLPIRFVFGPVIESPGPSAFLEENPQEAYKNGNVKPIPAIVGFNKDEGALFAAIIYLFPGYLQTINRQWKDLLPYTLSFNMDSKEDKHAASSKLRRYYLNDEPMSFWNRQKWLKMYSDRVILQGAHELMQRHSAIAPTFGYYFTYSGSTSFTETLGLRKSDWGVVHTDELIYLMNSTSLYPLMTKGSKDFAMSEYLINLWTSFAATGEPSFSGRTGWETIQSGLNISLFQIDESSRMVPFPPELLSRIKFWEDLGVKDDHKVPRETHFYP